MRALNDQEKRTIRLASILIGAVLLFSGVFQAGKFFSAQRAEYNRLDSQAQHLRTELQPFQDKAEVAKTIMEKCHIDPARLTKATVVAEASAAIEKAATSGGGGVQIGPIRETAARASARELASMQLDCTGPVPAMMTFLSRFESLGFPLILDSVQINPDQRPGMLKLHLTIIILDFDQWKEETPNA